MSARIWLPLVLAGLLTAPIANAQDLSVSQVARILAGMDVDDVDGLSERRLNRFRERVEAHWDGYESEIGGPMSAWAAENIESSPGETIFYPFGGPDFLTAHRLYPDAGRYVLVALQFGGRVPELTSDRVQLTGVLDLFEEATDSFADRGFFITDRMNNRFDAMTAPVDGITGVIMLMAEREGFEVLSVDPIRVREDGSDVEINPGSRDRVRIWDSVRLTLRRRSDGGEVLVDYVRLNLGTHHLEDHEADRLFIEAMAHHRVLLKAASHLMQGHGFRIIRELLLAHAPSILQDESGFDFNDLTAHFDVRIFGRFVGVNMLFTDTPQEALVQAYADLEAAGDVPAVGFAIGYRKSHGSCLQYAHLRRETSSE